MADNFPVTPGSGRNVATDQVTYSGDTCDIQLMRLVGCTGSEGSKTVVALPVDGTNGHAVYFVSAPDVNLRFDRKNISVQSGGLTTATTAYTAGDQVGTLFTIANAARASGGSGRIESVLLVSAADNIAAYDLIIFDSSVTLASDNAAFSISDADALKIVDIIPLSGAYDIGNNRIASSGPVGYPYVCSGGTSLYGALITRAAHTWFGATTDLQLMVRVQRD